MNNIRVMDDDSTMINTGNIKPYRTTYPYTELLNLRRP